MPDSHQGPAHEAGRRHNRLLQRGGKRGGGRPAGRAALAAPGKRKCERIFIDNASNGRNDERRKNGGLKNESPGIFPP